MKIVREYPRRQTAGGVTGPFGVIAFRAVLGEAPIYLTAVGATPPADPTVFDPAAHIFMCPTRTGPAGDHIRVELDLPDDAPGIYAWGLHEIDPARFPTPGGVGPLLNGGSYDTTEPLPVRVEQSISWPPGSPLRPVW